MSSVRATNAGLLLLMQLACTEEQPKWIPPDRTCPGALRPVWVADSSLTVCVVTSFRTQDLRTWRRDRVGSAADFLEIRTGVTPALSTLIGEWPPTLTATKESADGSTAVDSLLVREDTVAGHQARTEIGLKRADDGTMTYVFVSGWIVSDTLRGMAQGHSASRSTLDTLMLMMRTAQPWTRPAQNNRGR